MMARIETEIWVPSKEKKGYITYAGQRKLEEVFDELTEILKEEELYPPEYFLLSGDYSRQNGQFFPKIHDMYCYARWGSNEGIYIHIDIYTCDENENKGRVVHLITGKSLEETKEAYDRMQYTAGYIYRLFMGNGPTHARYMIVQHGEPGKNQEILEKRLESEAAELMKRDLFHGGHSLQEYAEEIGLKMMILAALTKCRLSEQKLEELFSQENVLDYLSEKCSSVMEANAYELNEILTSGTMFNIKKEV